jgi:hypothetical protein
MMRLYQKFKQSAMGLGRESFVLHMAAVASQMLPEKQMRLVETDRGRSCSP